MLRKLVTLTEAAAILSCTVSAMRRWRREKRIATVKVGRLVRIAETEIDRIGREGLRPASKAVRR
jgi:excisionase family DNA binding protein